MSPTHYIFNHIPKTGGISLLALCRDNLEAAGISPHLADDEIRHMSTAQFENYRLIAGHFSILAQAKFCRGRYSMTLVREPIKRIFSAYTYWRKAEESNILTSKAKELSFTNFVRYFEDSPTIIHNPYAHHFAALGRDFPAYPTDATALMGTAKHNLAAFDFVGICEQLGRSTRLLCHELGWPSPAAIPHENRSYSETAIDPIEPQTTKTLQDRNQLDSELYEYAVQLFNARESAAVKSVTAFSRNVERNRFVPFPAPLRLSRRAVILCVSARWVPDESSSTLEIAINFTTTAPTAELGLGVQLNDAVGSLIWGTNTANEILGLDCEVGRDSQAVFVLECDLPPGNYSLTVALSEPRRHGFHEHWIDNAAVFTVKPSSLAGSRNGRSVRLRHCWSTAISDVDC